MISKDNIKYMFVGNYAQKTTIKDYYVDETNKIFKDDVSHCATFILSSIQAKLMRL